MKTEKDTFRLAKILIKSFEEKLTPEEQEILNRWLDEEERHRELYRNYHSDAFLVQKLKAGSEIDWQQDYKDFIQKHISRSPARYIRQWIRYAAIFILPLSFAIGWWLIPSSPIDDKPTIASVVTEKSKPILTLAGGQKIILNNNVDVAETDGTRVAGENGQLVYKKHPDDSLVSPESPIFNRLEIPRGAEYFLTLTDGTKIWLNSETIIRYPVNFTGEKREVYLEGEAFFKVTKNTGQPFIVHTTRTEVEVLGTEFNVRNYNNEPEIVTTLVNGSVRLTSDVENEQIVLKPGEQGNIDKSTGALNIQEVDPYLYTAWKDARFVFRNTRMEELLNTLARWYDLQIFYQNNAVKDICFTGDMTRMEDFRQILNIIENNERVGFTIHHRAITVFLK